jgi:hypothetical protein
MKPGIYIGHRDCEAEIFSLVTSQRLIELSANQSCRWRLDDARRALVLDLLLHWDDVAVSDRGSKVAAACNTIFECRK